MSDNNIKLLIKLQDTETDTSKWVHLCYLDAALYENFCTNTKIGHYSINSLMAMWAHEDFGVTNMSIDTSDQLESVKDLIKDHYKNKYPEIYMPTVIDRQGWIRIWVTHHIQEELNGKSCD